MDARMQFGTYVVTPANEAAVAAARAVADAPGVVHNPLLIVGPAGAGKTHLLAAIAHDAEEEHGVESFTGEAFAESWRVAAKAGETMRFRDRLVAVDVLLIDDVQALGGHPEAAAGLAEVVSAREAEGLQVVATSDRAADGLEGIDGDLAKALGGGLAVQLGPTDAAEPGAHRGQSPAPSASLDFQGFVSDIASAVAEHVEGWKMRVAEAVTSWNAAGYRTAVLERLLDEPSPPKNYEAVLRGFGATVRRLKELEAEAITADPGLAGLDVFRDPERLREAEATVQRARTGAVELPGPSLEFSRTGFEVGGANQHAVNAADAVAAEPGERYNPLVLIGARGVGKTHLLNALGNELTERMKGSARVACVEAESFANEFLAALRDQTLAGWRQRYRNVDAILIDDLQAVAGKDRTQEELYYLIQDFRDAGKQVAVAADQAPRDLPGFDERLRSLLEDGMVVELAAPDGDLQALMYRRFLDGVPARQLDGLVAYLASRPAPNVSAVLDTIHRLTAAADAVGTPVTLEMAKRELEGPEPMLAGPPTPVQSAPPVRAAADLFFLDDEKVVWAWRDVASRVIEDLR